MRELTYVARRTVEWREAPDPELQADGEAIVAPVAATSCDVDSSILAGHGFIDPPFALGHECVARVVETGDAVTAVAPRRPRRRPLVHQLRHLRALPGRADRALHRRPLHGDVRRTDRRQLGRALLRPGPRALRRRHARPATGRPGPGLHGLGQRQLVPGLAPGRPHLRARPGARVLVVARCNIGLYVCDIARALGASEVLDPDPDPDPEHRTLARAFGAATAEALDPIPQGYDIAVEATGRVDQLALAVKSLSPEGICESAGNHFRPGELPLLDMYLTGVTLRIARDNVRAHIPDALGLAASGKVAPEGGLPRHRLGGPAGRAAGETPQARLRPGR
jgi:threonine dehydrogenase-like Zn-dependent dehydrogenase